MDHVISPDGTNIAYDRLGSGPAVRYWPTVTDPADDVARMLNTVPKYVASTTLREGTWPQTTMIGDLPGRVAELKRQPGKDIVVMGSSELARLPNSQHPCHRPGREDAQCNPRPATGRNGLTEAQCRPRTLATAGRVLTIITERANAELAR